MATCFLSDVIINLPFTNSRASVATWMSFRQLPWKLPAPLYNLEGVMRQVCLQPLPATSSVHLPLIWASGPDLYSCRRLKRKQTLSTNRAPPCLVFCNFEPCCSISLLFTLYMQKHLKLDIHSAKQGSLPQFPVWGLNIL